MRHRIAVARAWLWARTVRVGQRLRGLRRRSWTALVAYRAEIGQATAILGGWCCLTAAIATLLPARVVWLASTGLLLLSGAGWQFLGGLARHGLYVLTRARPDAPRTTRRRSA